MNEAAERSLRAYRELQGQKKKRGRGVQSATKWKDDFNDGRRLAKAGMSLAWDNAEKPWKELAWDTLREFAATGKGFNSDDIKDRIGEPDNPHAVGALFSRARRSGLIDVIGMRPMRGGKAHARMTFLYSGK